MRWLRRRWPLVAGLLLALAAGVGSVPALFSRWASPDWGAAAIVHPFRRPLTRVPQLPYETVAFSSGGESLEGWLFRPANRARGTVVYLHGIGDNRESGIGVARRLLPRGYAVFTFDGRGHGRSSGLCSYGYHERYDVSRALDALHVDSAVLLGHSLGASIALQAAAVDPRVRAVVAVSPFSDLRTIVLERARWLHLPERYVDVALARAGEIAHFPPEEASPVALAPSISVPVLLLHGGADRKTPPDHSRRIAAALRCPHSLRLLPGIGHDEILGRPEAWREIEPFLDAVTAPSSASRADARAVARRAGPVSPAP